RDGHRHLRRRSLPRGRTGRRDPGGERRRRDEDRVRGRRRPRWPRRRRREHWCRRRRRRGRGRLMRKQEAVPFVATLLLTVLGLVYTFVSGNHPLLGLDLQGGVSVVLQPTRPA